MGIPIKNNHSPMRFKRRFYDATVNFKGISKHRIMMSILIGLGTAFSIYGGFYVLRETFRVMSLGFGYLPIIVIETNRDFYNLFFASLSLILGNSIAIAFLFSRPQSVFSRRNIKRHRIINDQVALNGAFMFWFGKIGLMFGIMSINFLDFPYLSYLYVPFILLVMVMYLETWKTLITVLGRRKYKWLAIHFTSLAILAFGLSEIDIVDYKTIDESFQKEYSNIELPVGLFYDNDRSYYRGQEVNYKLTLDSNGNLLIVNGEGKQMALNQLREDVREHRNTLREDFAYELTVVLSADKDIDLRHIKEFEAELYAVNQVKIRYLIHNPNTLNQRFVSRSFGRRLPPSTLDFKKPTDVSLPSAPWPEFKATYKDTVRVDVSSKIKFDEEFVTDAQLVARFQKRINEETGFEYRYSKSATYQDYITVLSAHFKAVQNIRQSKASKGFDISKEKYRFTEEQKKELWELKEKYHVLIIEKIN